MSKQDKKDGQPKLDALDTARVQQAISRGWNRRDVMKLMMASGLTATAAQQLFS